LLNTNPIAWAVPALNHPPVFLDYATSMVAQGKIQAAVDKGVSIPNDWLMDANGNPTTDPTEQSRGGVMLPFGRHKGYCLSFLVELVSGGLTGTLSGALPGYRPDYATVMMAVNIAAFQPLDEFRQFVEQMIATTKSGRKAPGVEEILVPGEPEWRSRELRLRTGIEVPDPAWQRIVAAGAKCGVVVTA
jgi:LDH2 family malate/lactate/ureidoglycolate dehydrogenase